MSDSTLVEAALSALRMAGDVGRIDVEYAAYDDVPLSEPDVWGDLESFRHAAGR